MPKSNKSAKGDKGGPNATEKRLNKIRQKSDFLVVPHFMGEVAVAGYKKLTVDSRSKSGPHSSHKKSATQKEHSRLGKKD